MMQKKSGRTFRILVVDDEPVNRELLEDMLIPLGYDVVQASDGVTALQVVKESSPDVILLDVMMPGMDGFEVAGKLKQDDETKFIPIVMVTALKEVEDRIRALKAGANDFLAKPVDRAELQATVGSQVQVKAYHDFMKQHQKELEMEVARRTKQIRKAFEKIRNGSLDTIMRLARAAEYKDEDTGAHIVRMSSYSSAIARKMGLGDSVAQWILHAAPMHDIGKIGIPDRILLKPGKLDADEWEIMKQHTVMGARILQGAEAGYLRLAEIIAMTHHEKWDGTGYPHGLQGRKIPLVGRIVAIADVFDALISKRPYKEPFSLDKSIEIIKQGRGNHFDPDVVDAFLGILDEIVSIMEEHKDETTSLYMQLAGIERR